MSAITIYSDACKVSNEESEKCSKKKELITLDKFSSSSVRNAQLVKFFIIRHPHSNMQS